MKKKLLGNSMKAGAVLLCLLLGTWLPLNAAAFKDDQGERRISVKIPAGTLDKAVMQISKAANVDFSYNINELTRFQVKATAFRNEALDKVLATLLGETDLSFRNASTSVVIYRKPGQTPPAVEKRSPAPIQQQITVTGKVTDEKGEPLPGAVVRSKATGKGAITDGTGNYSITLPSAQDTLLFSYVSFQSKEEAVGGRNTINIQLTQLSQKVGEVVVTALGIKREQKALGYSMQQIDGSEVSTAKETNVINSLSGKIAGLQLYQGSGGPGGSAKIIIRGFNSLKVDGNEPLIVIDGMPLQNDQTSMGTSLWGGMDRGSDVSNINPDDIETISVLKGPAAAALYGTRGGNGVILITTKKGKAGKVRVNLNSSFTAETPLVFYDFQNEYAQGTSGQFNTNTIESWGPKITGQEVTDWTGKKRPLKADPNGVKNFFKTGTTFTNTVEVDGGTDIVTYRLGYTNLRNESIMPGYDLSRDNITGRINAFLFNKKLSIDAKLNYIKQDVKNRPFAGGYSDNIYYNFIKMPRSVTVSELNPPEEANGMPRSYYPTEQNPYWVLYNMQNNDDNDRYLSLISLQYQFTDWLKLQARHTMNFNASFNEVKTPMNTIGSQAINKGSYSFGSGTGKETNVDFLLTANRTFGPLQASVSLGGNQMRATYRGDGGQTTGLLVDKLWNITNSPTPGYYNRSITKRGMNSLYGFVNLSYKDFLFFDYTYRNDWSSTLDKKNRSFGYPSYVGSVIIDQVLRNFNVEVPRFISMVKVRGAIAEAGNDRGPYGTAPTYDIRPIPGTDAIGTELPNSRPNYELMPEIIRSSEIGLDLKLLGNRLGMDMTWYKKNAFNQIIDLGVSSTTGYNTRLINAGNVQNKGFEFTLTGSPVRQEKGFNWDITVNYSRNTNRMVELHPEVKQSIFTYFGTIMSLVLEGKDYGDFYGTDFTRNAEGKVVVDETGLPKPMASGANTLLGNFQPKWASGVYNTFSYKNLSMGFLLDIRQGGQIYSGTLASMYYYGTAAGTVNGRDEKFVVDGVFEDGKTNNVPVTAEEYWKRVAGLNGGGINSAFVYNANSVRLREVTLTYQLPRHILSRTVIKDLSLGFVARNLWIIHNSVPGIDPESSMAASASGFEYVGMPSTRSYGLNLKVGF
ncbi:SusC/RagA family TonB-linked outer membrane protein [Chitinophaga defluvii]|uniref:SusC/RagA family TonB-linked outer membrane protein n=1 Tax=Chitinophaga defluvii TaxID=3163343 RepID=A0ABV2T6Q9_9BACT